MSNRLLYLVTVAVWGTTWIAIELQLGEVAPEVSIFYRYGLATCLLFGWCLSRGLRLRFGLRAHSRFTLLGLFLFCLNYIVAYYAQVYITSAMTAIAFSTMVWMNIINARVIFGVRADPRVILGALLGVAGITILFTPEVGELSLSNETFYGGALGVAGAYLASLGNMVSQKAQQEGLPIIQSNAWGMFYGAVLTALIAAYQGQEFTFEWSAGYVLSLAYLAIFGSVIAFGAYLTLLGRIGAHKAGYAMVMFPVVALSISFLFEGLEPGLHVFAGVALVLLGNVFVLQSRKRPESNVSGPGKGQLEFVTER